MVAYCEKNIDKTYSGKRGGIFHGKKESIRKLKNTILNEGLKCFLRKYSWNIYQQYNEAGISICKKG